VLNVGAYAGDKATGCCFKVHWAWMPVMDRPRNKYRSEGTLMKSGQERGVPFLLVRFLWASKENERPTAVKNINHPPNKKGKMEGAAPSALL